MDTTYYPSASMFRTVVSQNDWQSSAVFRIQNIGRLSASRFLTPESPD